MIHTIGYAGTTLERFVQMLVKKDINLLIDVRTIARSSYFEMFNDVSLQRTLAEKGIRYENWKIEFGERQTNLEFFTNDILDYEKFAKSQQFRIGIQKLKEKIKYFQNICLMCAEIDPINCHRAVLCAREIAKEGFDIEHIILKRNGENFFENHKDFEARLQKTLKVNNLSEAYRKQNKKIGYKLT